MKGSVDPWRAWEDEVRQTGRPDRVARELTDEELVNLLAARGADENPIERHVLKQEALERLHRAHEAHRAPARTSAAEAHE